MLPKPELDQRINQLMQQLPLQRQQLNGQTRILTGVLRAKLSSPAALAVATMTGAFIGLWLQKPESSQQQPLTDHNSETSSLWSIIYHHMWLALWRALLS